MFTQYRKFLKHICVFFKVRALIFILIYLENKVTRNYITEILLTYLLYTYEIYEMKAHIYDLVKFYYDEISCPQIPLYF